MTLDLLDKNDSDKQKHEMEISKTRTKKDFKRLGLWLVFFVVFGFFAWLGGEVGQFDNPNTDIGAVGGLFIVSVIVFVFWTFWSEPALFRLIGVLFRKIGFL